MCRIRCLKKRVKVAQQGCKRHRPSQRRFRPIPRGQNSDTQTCGSCRSLVAALPLPSNPARLLTVRFYPAHTESQTPFSQAERRLLSCAKAGMSNQCHAITAPTARIFRQHIAVAPPTNPTSTSSSSSTPAHLPTPALPRPPKPHEIRPQFEAFNVPIAKESREKLHSNSLHGSLPSGLQSQYELRGRAEYPRIKTCREYPPQSELHIRLSGTGGHKRAWRGHSAAGSAECW